MTTYKEAGVDVEKYDDVLSKIQRSVQSTFTKDVLHAATTFKMGGTLSLKKFKDYNEPVLVLSTDGVGTKMVIAEMMQKFDTIGADIVNHGINDILTGGGKPMFFLDYVAAAKLDSKIVEEIVRGVAAACKDMDVVLAGGETAEMPGVYYDGRYELVGTMGGVVEKDQMIDGSLIGEGDALIGLPSNGLHTNGYSLARKIFFEDHDYSCKDELPELKGTLGDALLVPHTNYAKMVLPLIEKKLIKGIAHITGGGFDGNIPRILPEGLGVVIKKNSWDILPIFKCMQDLGKVSEEDMFRTFNMGLGMVLVVEKEKAQEVVQQLPGEVYEIGHVVKGKGVEYVGN